VKELSEDYTRNRDRTYPKINDPFMRPHVVKLLFALYTLVTPSVVNRASGFLRREAFICLERTSIRAALFSPDTYLELAG
jgi:hypothetical protein